MCLFFSFVLNAKRKRLKVSSKEGVQNIYKSVPMIVVWMVNQKKLNVEISAFNMAATELFTK